MIEEFVWEQLARGEDRGNDEQGLDDHDGSSRTVMCNVCQSKDLRYLKLRPCAKNADIYISSTHDRRGENFQKMPLYSVDSFSNIIHITELD